MSPPDQNRWRMQQLGGRLLSPFRRRISFLSRADMPGKSASGVTPKDSTNRGHDLSNCRVSRFLLLRSQALSALFMHRSIDPGESAIQRLPAASAPR
jgi:hypothetical protein